MTLYAWPGAGADYKIFDQYDPFQKSLNSGYEIDYRLKIVVLPKKGFYMAEHLIFDYKGKVGIMTIDGEAMSGQFAHDIPQLVKIGDAVGKPVLVSADGTKVENIDIKIAV